MSDALRFCLLTTFHSPCHFGGDAVFVHRLARGRRAALERWTEEVHLKRCLGLVRSLLENRPASRRVGQ